MINEEKAAGLGASDHANGDGTAGIDLSGEISTKDGLLLPFGLVGAFVVADGYQCPVVGDIGELVEEIGCHMATERPAKFGRKVGRLAVISAIRLRLALSGRCLRCHRRPIRCAAMRVARAAHGPASS